MTRNLACASIENRVNLRCYNQPEPARHIFQLQHYKSVLEKEKVLFGDWDWFAVKRKERYSVIKDVYRFDKEQLFNTATEDLAKSAVDNYRKICPVLDEPVISTQEMLMGMVADDQTVETVVNVEISFSGTQAMFVYMIPPVGHAPPYADLHRHSLSFVVRAGSRDHLKAEIERRVASINSHLSWMAGDLQRHLSELHALATEKIECRKEELLKAKFLVDDVGYEVKPESEKADTKSAYFD